MTELVKTDLDEWVADVASHLDGLPARERAEVLEDLRSHVVEVAADGGTLEDAASYAEELVRAADLHPAEVHRPRLAAGRPALVDRRRRRRGPPAGSRHHSVSHTQPVPSPADAGVQR